MAFESIYAGMERVAVKYDDLQAQTLYYHLRKERFFFIEEVVELDTILGKRKELLLKWWSDRDGNIIHYNKTGFMPHFFNKYDEFCQIESIGDWSNPFNVFASPSVFAELEKKQLNLLWETVKLLDF